MCVIAGEDAATCFVSLSTCDLVIYLHLNSKGAAANSAGLAMSCGADAIINGAAIDLADVNYIVSYFFIMINFSFFQLFKKIISSTNNTEIFTFARTMYEPLKNEKLFLNK